jgi:hypothetical protein
LERERPQHCGLVSVFSHPGDLRGVGHGITDPFFCARTATLRRSSGLATARRTCRQIGTSRGG